MEKLRYMFERKMWYKEAWTKNDISFYCRLRIIKQKND